MRVIKMRGSDHDQHPYRLDIERGGLRIVTLSPEEAETMKRRRRQYS